MLSEHCHNIVRTLPERCQNGVVVGGRDKVTVPVVSSGALSPELLQMAAVSIATEDADGEKRQDEEEEDK